MTDPSRCALLVLIKLLLAFNTRDYDDGRSIKREKTDQQRQRGGGGKNLKTWINEAWELQEVGRQDGCWTESRSTSHDCRVDHKSRLAPAAVGRRPSPVPVAEHRRTRRQDHEQPWPRVSSAASSPASRANRPLNRDPCCYLLGRTTY